MKDIVRRSAVRPSSQHKSAVSQRPRRSTGSWQDRLKQAWRGVRQWLAAHPRIILVVVVVLIGGLAARGLYHLGYTHGQAAQKKLDEKIAPETRGSANVPASDQRSRNSFSVSGSIESVSATEITVKPTTGDNKVVVIDKQTTVSNAKSAKVEVTTLKKGDRVFMSGTVEGDKSTARRIRVLAPKS